MEDFSVVGVMTAITTNKAAKSNQNPAITQKPLPIFNHWKAFLLYLNMTERNK